VEGQTEKIESVSVTKMKNDDVFEYHEDTDEKIQMTQNAAKRRDMY